MRQWLSFLLFLTAFKSFTQNVFEIPFTPVPIQIDGDLSEWKLPIVIPQNYDVKYRNQTNCGLYWDKSNLFIACKVVDTQLCFNEIGNNNPRLYLNDAIEVYIDSKNDSQNRMDLNDYQFLISINEHYTIFKGDKYQILEGNSVPKDHENTNILINTAVSVFGTLNDTSDVDKEYNIEVAIPWSTIGIIPEAGLSFKIDLCNNDIDTLTNFKDWPVDFTSNALNFTNIKGKNDYGFPGNWQHVTLIGKEEFRFKFLKFYQQLSWQSFLFITFLTFTIFYIIWYQNSKIRFYKNFPTKENLVNQEALTNEHATNFDKPQSAEVLQLKSYIEAHIHEDIAVEDIAKVIHTSVRQLQRILKAQLNITPKQYITIIRLEKASHLLLNGDLNITEISYACGFSDPSYFGTVFKKYFGKTPLEYKKSQHK